MYICHMHTFGGQMRALDLLEVESPIIMSSVCILGIEPGFLQDHKCS